MGGGKMPTRRYAELAEGSSMKTLLWPFYSRQHALWALGLAAIWMLVDYPIGLWLFLFAACAHRNMAA